MLSGRAALYLAATGLQAFKDLGVLGGVIAGAPDQGLETFSSQHAAIQMVDTPSPGATNVTSAFQNNMTVLKFIRYVSWALLRADAARISNFRLVGHPSDGRRH